MLADPKKQSRQYTIEEYLALEEKSEIRHEFYNGEIYAMAGGTLNHNLLIDSVKDILKAQLKGKGCRVLSENMKVEVIQGIYLPYPDLVLTCHPFDLRGDNVIIRQPRLLVEVLSKSTALHDRGFKWQRSRKMPSLWYYMLVDQYSTTVELFSRIDETDEWINTIYENREDVIVLPRLNAELRIGAIYDGIDLIPETDEIPADEQP
ncbi:Uma2 family endonuclease [Spirosoma validum]|uniref:Uma2 family endonuclease n=1 Tax=Spirosoma validum TaxID=2771355 RepID=A0A927GFG9_9BACT|nr:Uma2 family endonuclease [Spirosoma validum]MBD2755771.1 Uma2 family endonuclease [Spirosoma validum]